MSAEYLELCPVVLMKAFRISSIHNERERKDAAHQPDFCHEDGYVGKDNEGRGTTARSRKKSFYWYQKVIASNGEELS